MTEQLRDRARAPKNAVDRPRIVAACPSAWSIWLKAKISKKF